MSPLAGIRVVEIAQNLAGPFAGQILAMLGAEVIKLERPEGGDDARGWGPPMHEGTATTFIAVNRGKRPLSLPISFEGTRPQPARGVPAAGEDSADIRAGLRWAPR
ncbi:MAG: CoA transferase [Alphaproteobacteria bacterium]